jgi:nucleotide-binding universal stress UspA family protein
MREELEDVGTASRPRDAGASKMEPDARRTPSRGPIEHVLICLDNSRLGERVLPHARAVLKCYDARGTLLHVLEQPDRVGPADLVDWQVQRAEAESYLTRTAAAHGESGNALAAELVQGNAAEQICQWIDTHDVDLTVVCSHGAGGGNEWALASTARKLVEGPIGSLFVIPVMDEQGVSDATAEVRYRTIAVPLDGSQWAESVLPLVVRVAERHGAEILLIHAVLEPELIGPGPLSLEDLELKDRVVRRNERVAGEYLFRTANRINGLGCAVRTTLVRERGVRSELVRAIEHEHADLIVMSAHGQSAHLGRPCGKVAAYLIANSRVPLLLVRDRPSAVRQSLYAARDTGSLRLPVQASREP